MAKDAKGHGSETHGGGAQTPVQQENAPFKSRLSGKNYLDPHDPRGGQTAFSANFQKGSGVGGGPALAAGAHSQGVQDTPQLQRRHFEAIATDLKNAPDAGSPAHAQRVSDMANKLSTTNPGFRRDFFVAAATPGGTYRNKGPGKDAADVQKRVAPWKESRLTSQDRAKAAARAPSIMPMPHR